jgi:hypothetical protein
MPDNKDKIREHSVRIFGRLMEVLVKRRNRINKDKEKKGDTTTDNVKKFETCR